MPVSSNVPSSRETVPAFAGDVLAPPPWVSSITRAYGTGPELSDATILPRSVAPVVTTIRASVGPAVTPVGALGARPLADATSSYSPGGTSTWNRPAGSITDCAVYSA